MPPSAEKTRIPKNLGLSPVIYCVTLDKYIFIYKMRLIILPTLQNSCESQKCILETVKYCGHIRWSKCEGLGVGSIHPRMKLGIPLLEPFPRVLSTSTNFPSPHHFGPRNLTSCHHALYPEIWLAKEKLAEAKICQRESASACWTEQWAVVGVGAQEGQTVETICTMISIL